MTERFQSKKARALLLAGIEIFGSKGFHAVTVDDILNATGISRATFYKHFENKEDLFSVIVDGLLKEQSAYVLNLQQTFFTEGQSLADTVERVIDTLVVQAEENRALLRFFFYAIPGSGTRAEARFAQMQQVTLDHFHQIVGTRLQAQGYSQHASRALATFLLGGLVHICRLILEGQIKRNEVDSLIRGIRELSKTES